MAYQQGKSDVCVFACACACVQAAYLQKGGLKTAVLERRHVLGGAAVSEEIVPGRMTSGEYLAVVRGRFTQT